MDKIAASGSLEPGHCSVFGEPLLYFFYGKPAFRGRQGGQIRNGTTYAPICIVFRPGALATVIKRVFPFDSGAGKNGQYGPQITATDVTMFDISSVSQAAQRLVAGFFATNASYWAGCLPETHVTPPENTQARAYYDLVKCGGAPNCDDRKTAIEFQTSQSVTLAPAISAVVLPDSYLECVVIKEALATWNAMPLTYEIYKSYRPIEFHSELRKLVKQHCEHQRWL